MLEFLQELSKARMDTLFVLAGLVFLAVAILGNISGKIQPGTGGRIASGIIGPILIAFGLWIHIGDHVAGDSSDKASPPKVVDGGGKAPEKEPPAPPTTSRSPEATPVAAFSGRWRNIDPKTRGITTVEIEVQDSRAWVHAWGACQPTDCDWGRVEASPFASGVSSPDVRSLSAVYTTGFSQTGLTLRLPSAESLEVESATHFTDRSGRSDYSAMYAFRPSR